MQNRIMDTAASNEVAHLIFKCAIHAGARGGSRGGQSGHATHVKNAQVINIQS